MGTHLPLLREPEIEVVYECRSCGTTVDHEDATCPYCSLSRIVCYELT